MSVGSLSATASPDTVAHAGLKNAPGRYGVSGYRLTYRTVADDGTPTTATGLVALPEGATSPLAIATYGHGTIVARSDAPSQLHTFEGVPVAALFASNGFAYAAPDYLGLGGGSGSHPYLDRATEASASLDLLRALRTFAARRNIALRSDVYVTGFSQGGQTAMAVADALDADPSAGFQVRAVAPIDGPLDLSRAEWPALFDGSVHGDAAMAFLAQALVAWNRRYHLFPSTSSVFAERGGEDYATLFDGLHSDVDVHAAIPDTLQRVLTPTALAAMRHPTGRLEAALHAGDSCKVRIPAPVRIYQARGDEIVTAANAERCAASLRALGVDVTIVYTGDVDHVTSAFIALPLVERWFSSLSAG